MFAILLAAALPSANASAARLNLTCFGVGAANKADVSTIYGQDSAGNSASGSVTHHRSEGFADQVDLWIAGEEGRIRLPRNMLPVVRGGDDGWFKLKSIKLTDVAISASASVNPINNPKVYVDRRTGVISINGKAGHFGGQCDRTAPTTQRRF